VSLEPDVDEGVTVTSAVALVVVSIVCGDATLVSAPDEVGSLGAVVVSFDLGAAGAVSVEVVSLGVVADSVAGAFESVAWTGVPPSPAENQPSRAVSSVASVSDGGAAGSVSVAVAEVSAGAGCVAVGVAAPGGSAAGGPTVSTTTGTLANGSFALPAAFDDDGGACE
jgi:hypothetical protein